MRYRRCRSPYSTIIVTYNSENEIGGLLEELTIGRNPQPVIVVDNASRDGTVLLIQQRFPQVHLVENKVDMGYAWAVNQAFRLCRSEYFFLLNPDIRLPDRSVASSLLDVIQHHPEVAAVAPLQFKSTDQKLYLNFTWSYWTPKAFALFLSSLLKLRPPEDDPIPVTYLNAGCLFIRSKAFREVGMFNEKYFLYGEEPDLFLKFKRAGYISLLLPDTYVIHLRESSMKSLASSEYMKAKLQGSANILDAIMTGWFNILRDTLMTK
ncbi:MAG: glycosyltransferase family 2 protein [Anaerolineaceae bacterium]|nr:glycosyltransferase family 2 protein [Anaerolineaceae bacterium]